MSLKSKRNPNSFLNLYKKSSTAWGSTMIIQFLGYVECQQKQKAVRNQIHKKVNQLED